MSLHWKCIILSSKITFEFQTVLNRHGNIACILKNFYPSCDIGSQWVNRTWNHMIDLPIEMTEELPRKA